MAKGGPRWGAVGYKQWVLPDWHCHGAMPAYYQRAIVAYQAATLLVLDQELCYL